MTLDASEQSALSGARVLLVEDNPASARLAAMMLRGARCDVQIATTAAQATKLVVDGMHPNIVLLDLDLPDLSGMDLTKVLRALDDTRERPIIAVTSSGIMFGELAAMSAGCDAFVRKPIEVDTFLPIVASFLQPGWTRRPPPPARVATPTIRNRHEAILDAIPTAVCVARPSDLAVIYANRKFEEVTGYTLAQLLGLPMAVANPDGSDGTEEMRATVQAQLDERGEATFEVPRRRADGSFFWVQVTTTRLDDVVLGELWLMAFDDVTRRRHADDELKTTLAKSRTRFASMWDAGVLAMVIGDKQGAILDANDLFLAMLGWTRDDVVHGRLRRSDFALPDREPGVRAELDRLGVGKAMAARETECIRKDGTRVPVIIGGALIDERTYLGFAIDLTEKKRNEAALGESQRRFDALWRSGVIGVAISDQQGFIVEANDAYLALVGYTAAEVEARMLNYVQLTPPSEGGRLAAATEQLQRQGFAEPWETETLRKDGSRVSIAMVVAAIDPVHSIAIVSDLSSRKQAEEKLRRTEDQLRHAQKMEAVGRLAGGVAHDFNNILTVIVSYSDLMLRDLAAGDPMRVDLEEIARAAMRAADLTRQLLVFSRQNVIETSVLHPNEVVLGMHKMLHRLLGEDVELVTIAGEGLGRVRLAPSHLEQVIVNLAVNARDAMPEGGKLTIETSNADLDEAYAHDHMPLEAGRYVMLAVTDTGCGMDPETQARIFEPFFTTKPIGKGTGLGLSIVFGIVQQNDGHVWVYSEPDHGTTFKIYFPRVDAVADQPRPAVASASLRGTETILLVEDEAQVRRVADGILTRGGYQVLVAQNPGEALLICESYSGTIDLLLTDVVMPQMNGPELARRLSLVRPGLRVLCMSGYTDDSVVRHRMVERGVAFLQKPFTPDILSRKVREVLDAPPLLV